MLCQAVRAPGEKLTDPADARCALAGVCSISTFTSPVKCCADAVITARVPARETCSASSAASACDSSVSASAPASISFIAILLCV